jgi:cell volume regulation protein A
MNPPAETPFVFQGLNTVPFEFLLFGIAVLLLLNIIASKISTRLGVPALLIFMVVGMLAGSDGPGGIHFDDPRLVQSIGVVALAFILFAGGMDTNWKSIRPVLRQGVSLSTLGVFITALLVGWFAHLVLDFSLLEGMLLGAIVSSTDAAAVFAVLRSRNVSLKGTLKPLLELESGSNDPMAVFLTTGFIMLLTTRDASVTDLVPMLSRQMSIGAVAGYVIGRASVVLINRLRLEYDGLYSVLTLSLVLFNYGITSLVQGNGFLSVYIAGLVMGNSVFIKKRTLVHFHDGLAWLMQITMFLVLGLQVYPSKLVPVAVVGLLTAVFLIAVARPAAVFLSLLFAPVSTRRKTMISWVGLRGAVPIILATFPLLAGISQAEMIFHIVFFVVLTSALIQGTTIPPVARWLRLDAPLLARFRAPFEFEPGEEIKGEMAEIEIMADSYAVNRQIVDLGLPAGALVIFIKRNNEYLVPGGSTVVKKGDVLHVLGQKGTIEAMRHLLEKPT